MNEYLIEQEFSTKRLLDNIYTEEKALKELSQKVDELRKHFDHLYSNYSNVLENEDSSDTFLKNAYLKMAKKFNEHGAARVKLRLFKYLLKKKERSIESLAMSLLQIAKQGISVVYKKLDKCPKGRNLGAETLKIIIWQGRNQAIHYEEGNPRKDVINCFENLRKDFGSDFDIIENPKVNKAKKIIDLLEWHEYENYKTDMISLIG